MKMERITSKQVISMMDAVAQVYKQPEVEQLDEIVRNLRPGETIKQYDERKKKEAEAAAQNRDKIVPNRGAYDELTKAQQNSRTQRENEKRLEDLRRQRRNNRLRDDEEGLKPTSANLPSDLKDTEQTATAAGQKVAGKVSGSLPADYKETELQAGRDAEKSRTGAGLPQSGGGNQGQGSTTPKPQLTDQQKVRAEYDRLRKKDPKTGKVMGSPEDLKKAAAYGMAMSKAGAANKDFSGYKSAADLDKAKSDAKSPAPAQRTSIAQRLQAIRDMRAAAQSRIAAQGGTPATSAAKPKPKVAPPPVPSTTGTSTTPTTKQQLKNGDPMERMTGKGAQSLKESYNAVYEERTEEDAVPGKPSYHKDDVDFFDIIKGHFIEEGLTEEEALAKMLDLTDEERTEIIEGSCGSMKKKKKSRKGGY